MGFISDNPGIHFCSQPISLARFAVAVVLLERLHLQCCFIDQSLGELQALFGLIHIEPCERRIATDHPLLIIERRAVRIGVELLASALEPALFGAREILTQADRKLGEVIAASAEGFRRIDRQLFESARELRIGQLRGGNRLLILRLNLRLAPRQ